MGSIQRILSSEAKFTKTKYSTNCAEGKRHNQPWGWSLGSSRTRKNIRAWKASLCRCCLHPDMRAQWWFWGETGRKVCSLLQPLLAVTTMGFQGRTASPGLGIKSFGRRSFMLFLSASVLSLVSACSIHGTETKFLTATCLVVGS